MTETEEEIQARHERFAEYDRISKEMTKRRIRLMPWYKRMMFVTIGDIWDKIFSKKSNEG